MKTSENAMKDFQNIMKATEKNKVLKYCIVLLFGLFHAYKLQCDYFTTA